MIRTFIALDLPETRRRQLALIQHLLPGGRAVAPESLHVTLLFLGEQPEHVLAEVDSALGAITAAPFTLHPGELGVFGGDKPRSVHLALRPDPALEQLHARICRAVAGAGLPLPRRRFIPHVTLRRYAPGEGSAPALARAIAAQGLITASPFPVAYFSLMRSRLRPEGPAYDELARYPLTG